MNFITLTSTDGGPIYVNVSHIGHFYPSKVNSRSAEITKVGVTTHNNGGFSVTETVDEILFMIQNLNN